MTTKTFKKGEIIQRSGERSSKIFFVKSGLLRSYSIDEKGKEHIFLFAPEQWTMADANSPTEPTQLFIDALEDSTVNIFEKNLNFSSSDALKLAKRMSVLQNRIIMLMSVSAIDRYKHFVESYPDIVQRVPQRMIASYLGITPEALSKVKNQKK